MSKSLVEFVTLFCRKHKVRNIDLASLNTHTSVEVDLNLDEFEIDWFLEAFSNEFHVDFSEFRAGYYLYRGNNFFLLSVLRTLFGYRSTWIKKFADRTYKPRLRLGHLQKAIEDGKIV